jgi:hypothetical protein
MAGKVVKTATTFAALDGEGDSVYECYVEYDRAEAQWVLIDGDNGTTISRHLSEAEAIKAAKAECAQYILPWPLGTK